MFFPERVKKISWSDRVLEIGPGSTPHPRSDIFLEKLFSDSEEYRSQRGNTPDFHSSKPIVYYEGDVFPFKDKEFDYVICSHVLEHVPDAAIFLNEMTRVAKRGYLEYPTIYYDYLYNFKVHTLFLMYKHNIIYWMEKAHSPLNEFAEVQHLFYNSLEKEHYGLIDSLKDYFFQGFEWEGGVATQKVGSVKLVCYDQDDILIQKFIPQLKSIGLKKELKKKIIRLNLFGKADS